MHRNRSQTEPVLMRLSYNYTRMRHDKYDKILCTETFPKNIDMPYSKLGCWYTSQTCCLRYDTKFEIWNGAPKFRSHAYICNAKVAMAYTEAKPIRASERSYMMKWQKKFTINPSH